MASLDEAIDDVLAAPTPPSTSGGLDSAVDDVLGRDRQRGALRATLDASLGFDPTTAAQARSLGAVTGVPVPIAERNLSLIAKQAQAKKADWIFDTSPALARSLSDLQFAKVAHDDIEPLSRMESALRGVAANWAGLAPAVARGYQALRQEYPTAKVVSSAKALDSLDRVEQLLAAGTPIRPADDPLHPTGNVEGDDPLHFAAMTPAQRAAMRTRLEASIASSATTIAQAETVKRSYPQADIVQRVTAASKDGWLPMLREFMTNPPGFIAAVGIESGIANLPVLAAGAVVPGGLVARATTAGAGSFLTDWTSNIVQGLEEAGVDVSDAAAVQRAARDPVLMQRIGREAWAHASVVSVVDAASGHVAGALTLPKRMAARLAAKPVARELANLAVQTPVQGVMGAAGEAGGELAAGQRLDPFQIFAEFAGEAVGAPLEVAAIGGRAVGDRVGAGQAAVRAERAAMDLAAVGQVANESKLRARDPAAFREFVRNATEDGPVQDVFVDARTFESALAQSGMTHEQLAATVPEVAEQLAAAVPHDGDVRIAVEDYATHVAGSKLDEALQPHLRVGDPEAMSLADAQRFHQEDAQAAQAETVAVEAQAASEGVQQATPVRDAIAAQLAAVNRFVPAVNERYADLLAAFYTATAERAGVTPEQLLEQQPVRIAAERLDAGGFDQQPDAPAGVDQAPTGPVESEPLVGSSADRAASGTLAAPAGRGFYDPATKTIGLLKNADLSTFVHEAAHRFLDAYGELAAAPNAPAGIKADMATVLAWFGIPDVATWNAMSLDQQREHHERFARGFEAYAFEGESPSLELDGVFARFRAWLVTVYRNLTALRVELSPEVRAVMGRMLATDAQIATASTARQHRALFESAEAAGMDAESFAAYQRLGQDASDEAVRTVDRRTLRDLQWLSNAKSRALRRLQREADTQRAAVRAEVAAEVQAEPVNAARRFLEHGETVDPETGDTIQATGGHRLDAARVGEMYPESALDRPEVAKLQGLTQKGGLDPEQVAQAFGFSSGDELVRTLIDATPAEVKIDALTDRRMLEEHGDITSRDALKRAAEAAIANESRGRMLAREVGQLSAAVGRQPILQRAARQYAERFLAERKVRELRPSLYRVAEARAGREAEAAFRKGDTAGAAAAKRAQLLNHELDRAAQRARVEVDKAVAYLRRFGDAGPRGSIDRSYLDQIEALLERYDLRQSVTDKELARRKSLRAWVDAQRELGFEPTIDDRLLDEARRVHFRDATLTDVRGLVDAVKNIEHLGRLKTRLLTEREERAFGAVVDVVASTIVEHGGAKRPTKIESNSSIDRAVAAAGDFMAAHRKFASLVREMDGFADGGPIWQTLVRSMNDAGNNEAVARERGTIALGEIFGSLSTRNKLSAKVFIKEIGTSLSREGRLAVALNWGNAANRQRVTGGDGWTPGQVTAILRTLSTEELHFVQRVWDHVNTYWPSIAAKELRVTGVAPQKVEASPFSTVSADGAVVALRGGYYPIKYDPTRSSRAESDTMAESIRSAMQGLYTRATTRRGHTKDRVDELSGRPVRKDLGVLFEHVEQVTHDLAWHEWLIDANRLLRAPAIDAAIRDHYGSAVLRTMKDHLEAIAAGDVPAQSGFERSVNYLRTGATIAGLGWNLTTSLLQPLGLSQSMVRIGPKWVARGLASWIGDAARMENTVRAIGEKSDFMRLRAKTMQREIAEIRNRVSGEGPFRAALQSSLFYFITKMQLVADVPTWSGMYEKALDAGADEASAVAQADQAVIDAQGGGQIKDLAAIQRGGPLLKLWTNFYSFFNVLHNLSAEAINRTDVRSPAAVGVLAADMLLLYVVPSALSTLLKAAIKGELDDPDKLGRQLVADQASYLMGTMLGVREFSAAAAAALGLPSSYSGPAGARVVGESISLAKQAGQGEADAAFWHSLNNVGGVLFHYPALQLQRTVEGVHAVAEGRAGPQAILFGPPKDAR